MVRDIINKIRKEKAGEESNSFIAVLIMILLIIIVLFFFINTLNEKIAKSFDDKTCDEAMKMYAKSPKGSGESDSDLGELFLSVLNGMDEMAGKSNNVPCETRFIEIKDDDEKEIKKKTAKALVGTWKTFGRGNYDLFSNTEKDSMNFCVIRYYLDFEGKAKDKKIEGLFQDMKDTEIKVYSESQLQYITNSVNPEPMDFTINTSYDYVVVYVHSRDVHSVVSTLIGSGVGAAAGGTAAAGGVVIATVAFMFTPITVPAGIIIGASTVIGGIAGAYAGHEVKDLFADDKGVVMLIPYTEEGIGKLNCDFFPGEQQVKRPK